MQGEYTSFRNYLRGIRLLLLLATDDAYPAAFSGKVRVTWFDTVS
jgi:hypothetical protein